MLWWLQFLLLPASDQQGWQRARGTSAFWRQSSAYPVVFHLLEKVTYSQLGSLPGHYNPMLCLWCESHSAIAQGRCYLEVMMVISRSETVTQIKQRAVPAWHLWPMRWRGREKRNAVGLFTGSLNNESASPLEMEEKSNTWYFRGNSTFG